MAAILSVSNLAFAADDISQGLHASPMSQSPMGGWMEMAVKRLESTITRSSTIFATAPKVPGEWSAALSKMFYSDRSLFLENMKDLRIWFFILTMIFATGFLPRWLTARANQKRTSSRFVRALRRLGFELFGIAISLAIAAVAAATILTGPEPSNDVRFELLYVVVRWRLTSMLVTILLRPDDPDIRLLNVDTPAARKIMRSCYYSLAIIIIFTTLVPFFGLNGVSIPSLQIPALIIGTISVALFVLAQRQLSVAMPAYRGSILFFGSIISLTTWAIWSLSVIFLDFTVYYAFLLAALAAWLLLAMVRILDLAKIHQPGVVQQGILSLPLISAIQRSMFVVAALISGFILARIWAVEVFGFVMDEEFRKIAKALAGSFVVLVIGYIIYEATRAWAAARFGTESAVAGPEAEDVDELQPRSRLGTIIPFLTGSFLVVIVIIAVLFGLSDLGFNTAPILAGAGIFGLAISFGSQALVRDIVSGIFYMVDDAFRVGEYIEAGRLKGTVEKILLRSLRVRHQNGQFHTIPYGQLGAVTNYSRDWSTIKFNLSLARDSDLEQVRKAAKQCGLRMLEDPEFGPEFILPLKFQGVANITENAVICRFKFTVRPLKPTQVQREALKRLHFAFAEKGVQFATHSVKVIADGDGVIPESAYKAAAARTAYASEKPENEIGDLNNPTVKLVLAADASGRD